MEKHDLELLVLAALLHDIGVFAHRAGEPVSDDATLRPDDPSTTHSLHAHASCTGQFVQDAAALPLPHGLAGERERLARLAVAHHMPGKGGPLEKALQVADRLAAGTDRIVETAENGDDEDARLHSVFTQVGLRKGADDFRSTTRGFHRLSRIRDAPFPASLEDARTTSYRDLFEVFLSDLATIPVDMGNRHYIASLVSLLERFTWCIPHSVHKGHADISLYDHAMTTAAIAQALAVHHDETGRLPGEDRDGIKFVLFGGDLSGIQRYIFGIDKSHGAGVAKIFRARSFLLQMLTKSVILKLLDDLGLVPVAKILDAGGRFILLLPATERVRQRLPAFEREAQHWFFERFKGELSLNLSHRTELTEEDLALEAFRKKFDALNDDLELRKLSKFDMLMQTAMSPVLGLDSAAYQEGECAVCKANPVDPDSREKFREEHGRDVPICSDCREQIDVIGKRLPDARYLVFTRGEAKGGIRLFGGIFLRFEAGHVDKADASSLEITNIRSRDRFAYHAVARHLPRFTPEDMNRWEHEGRFDKAAAGARTFLGETVASGAPKTFSALAAESQTPDASGSLRGKSLLGAFKADVDNLGFLFSLGLGDRLSISRFACLSRMLNHFFADHLVRRIERDYRDIYVVFAGGDDLFVIGPWTTIIEFARFVQAEFARFVAGNPEVTLSAGIAVAKPQLPVQNVARAAEELLGESKARCRADGIVAKNAVTLFGVTCAWEDFGPLLDKGERFGGFILDRKITTGLAQRLLRYSRDAAAVNGGPIRSGLYLSHMSYDLRRNVDEKKFAEDEEGLRELLGIGFEPGLMARLGLPVSYALYRTRKDKGAE